MKRVFLAINLFIPIVFSLPLYAEYRVDCSGQNDETGNEVTGECEDGYFSGEDQETGNSISGDCEFDGSFDATDDDTGESASGSCDGE